jgi:hypothetical protein
MRITLIVVNLMLGFVALLVTLGTVRWQEHPDYVGRSGG